VVHRHENDGGDYEDQQADERRRAVEEKRFARFYRLLPPAFG